jgi:hypothetical protein
MWAAFWNVLRIVGVTSLFYSVEEKLRYWFGGDDEGKSPFRPYLFLIAAGAVVYLFYKFVLGKKIIIK